MSNRLASFLYDLMRDHLTPGMVEDLVQESVDIEVAYTNGYLAQYALDMAKRLCPPQSDPKLSTGKSIQATESVDPVPDPNKYQKTPIERPAPEGLYGVFCEPLGHKGDPCWTQSAPKDYAGAAREADFMNRANQAWHYYAKPIK